MALPKTTLVFIISILCIAVVLFYWQNQQTSVLPESENEETVEFFITQPKSKSFREDGSLHYEFESESMEYFQASDTTKMKLPKMVIYTSQGDPWHARANTATILPENEGILLRGEVYINQDSQRLNIRTEELLIMPDKEYAETQHHVIIQNLSGITTGTGMKADLIRQNLKLLANVRSTYANMH